MYCPTYISHIKACIKVLNNYIIKHEHSYPYGINMNIYLVFLLQFLDIDSEQVVAVYLEYSSFFLESFSVKFKANQ